MVHLAARPGADAERAMMAETLAKELAGKHGDDLKAFLCQQLQLCGRTQEVPALAALLGSERLCDPATLALGAIGTPEAAAALRESLPKAAGKRRQTIVNALGRLRDKASAVEIRKDAAAPDADLRSVAWYALAQSGDAASIDVLLKAAEGPASYERNLAVDACLRMALRLGEAGNAADAERICKHLIAARKDPADSHDRCAALAVLARAAGAKAVEEVLAAMGSSDARYRHPAARTAVDLARAIRKEKPQEAEKLLKKTVEVTTDGVVKQEAEFLMGKYGA
jgi:sulfur relay (sulfurtransferase) complex TusBCD TusD component (DsrE family)